MIDVDVAIALIQHNFPQVAIQTVQPITSGWDSFVLEVNGELIFRFPTRNDVVEYLQMEMRLLPILEKALSTSIPHFSYIGHGDANYPFMFVGYRKLVGISLEDENIPSEHLAALAADLGTFLSELHGFPVAQAVQASVEEHTAMQWRERYQDRYTDLQKRAFPLLDRELHTRSERLWEDFLSDRAIFTFQPVLLHCDLNCEHIFYDVEHGMLTGIIDWGDATIGDPAQDFVGLLVGRGRAFTERVLAHYQGVVDATFWRRMDFYLCYIPFSELLYGAYSGKEQFIAQGIERLHTMFGV